MKRGKRCRKGSTSDNLYYNRLAESEGDLQRVVNEFYSVCKRRKLKVNAGKSMVMVFERREVEVVDFNTANRVRLPAVASCRVMLGSEEMEEMS